MDAWWKGILDSLVMGMLVPGLMISIGTKWHNGGPNLPIVRQPSEETVQKTVQETPQEIVSQKMKLLAGSGSVEQMELEDYVTSVLLGEMPGTFELEALKAQAVVARTVVCRAMYTGGKHGQGAVCTQSSCCQAFVTEEEYLNQGGAEETIEKMRTAANQTAGQILTYGEAPIEATYFSCSGGRTEDAVAVWGTELSYLKSVESPGEEEAAHYRDEQRFSGEDFSDKLGLSLTGDPAGWFGKTTYTAGGGVDTMQIGDSIFRGTELRTRLGLRSTAFTVAIEGGEIVITTQGFGHRVGMSQYGANAMASDGYSYQQILEHYYSGTTLDQWDGCEKRIANHGE